MEPITRREMYLAAAAGYDVDPPEPITREEVFLAKLAGMEVETPVPYTRRERFIEEAAVAANKAVIEPLTITENGTYTAPEGVDGYNPVTVEIDPTKVTILQDQEISGFALDADFGYLVTDQTPTYTITKGEKYYVVWDGVTYETTALAADSFMEGAVFLGNGTMLGLPGNNEPFAIGYVNGAILYTAFTDDSESHTVGIYQDAIKLQNITITENGEYTADDGFGGIGRAIVNVAGSGGGSLPAGLYYMADSMPLPIRYGQRFFKYNGDLYLLANPAASGSNPRYLYKHENGAWTKLGDVPYSTLHIPFRPIEINGKLHFCAQGGGGYNKKHSVYDGSTVVGLNDLPNYVEGTSYFIQDEKLKAYSYNDHNVYVWDEETDSWTSEANLGGSGEIRRYFTEYNGVMYCVNSSDKSIYSYSGGKLTYLRAVNFDNILSYDYDAFVGKYMYATENRKLYKVDVENGNVTKIGEMTITAGGTGNAEMYYLEGYGLRLHGCDYQAPATFFNMILYEVTE